jgi:hypothetical protein
VFSNLAEAKSPITPGADCELHIRPMMIIQPLHHVTHSTVIFNCHFDGHVFSIGIAPLTLALISTGAPSIRGRLLAASNPAPARMDTYFFSLSVTQHPRKSEAAQ